MCKAGQPLPTLPCPCALPLSQVFRDRDYPTADPSCYCPRANAKGWSFLMKKVALGWEGITCKAYCEKYPRECAAGAGNAACDSSVANVCNKLS